MSTAKGSIVLTGFMGTGKSSVGIALGQMLGLEFVDTDALIAAEHGPVEQLVATRGEEEYRLIEQSVIHRVLEQPGRVIATGGATVLDPVNAQALASAGLVYCLVASPHEIARRMDAVTPPTGTAGDTDTMTRVTDLLKQRLPAYSQFPQVRTDGRSPEAIAQEIANDSANRGLVKLGKAPKPERTKGRSPLIVGAAAFVVIGLLGGLALYLTRGGDEPAMVARDLAPPSEVFPEGAPEGDLFIDLVLINEQSRQADERVREFLQFQGGFEEGFGGDFGQQLVDGSVIHVGAVGSRIGTLDLYQWDAVTRFPGERPQELTCSMALAPNQRNGGQSCFPSDFVQGGPSLNWSGIENGRDFLNTINVVNAPDDALWMSTEMRNGDLIVSRVVGGFGYAEWDGFDGDPGTVTVLDANLDELWSERMF